MSESDYLKGYEAGAVDYMSVPVVPELLRAKVRVFSELFRKTGELHQLNAELEKRVSERTKALETSSAQLYRSEQGRGLALAAGQMGSWDWDIPANKWMWDEGQRRIFGVSQADFVPDIEVMRSAVHPDDRNKLEQALADLKKDANSFEFECRIRRPDGAERWCRNVGAAIFDENENLLRIAGVTTDISSQKEAEEKQALLAREVDHRAKNALAVVQAIVRLARRDSVQEFVDGVEGRIKALAQTHELLSHARWKGADVLRLVLEELEPYQSDRSGRITAIGPSVTISPENAQSLAIALHELATNAAKYGSLSSPDGRVDVNWYVFEDMLNLKWTEAGGPAVVAPRTRGFGTKIITASLGDPRRGSVLFDWRSEGLVCELALRIDREKDWKSAANECGDVVLGADKSDMPSILLVEDEILVGLLMQEMLQEMGYSVGEPCRTLKDALLAASSGQFAGAVLDMNLAGEAVYPVAELLKTRNIPFVFVTGYAPDAVDKKYSQVPIIQKPVSGEALAGIISAWISQPKGASREFSISPSPGDQNSIALQA
jgi:PAS domain S-box-containing protein